MLGGVLPVPDVSGWFEGLFPKPDPPEPMVKGQPQEPASNQGKSVALDIGTAVGTGIETAVVNVLARMFPADKVRDAGVYLGAAILLIIAVWAVLQ